MNFQKGDIVRTDSGSVDWEVDWSPRDGWWWFISGMSGRRRLVRDHQIKPWVPGA